MHTSPHNDRESSVSALGPDARNDRGRGAEGLAILVVDDHEFQRSMVVEMLEGLGARFVHEAEDGAAALEITRELDHPFDVIVTDIDMPGMDGMAFIRHLGEAKVTASLIISSSLDRSLLDSIETMSAAYGIRLLGTIEKPATPKHFADLIALHRNRRLAPERLRIVNSPYPLDEILAGLANAEFEPFFQPKIDLRTGQVKGAEALARWRHPAHGVVLPHAFIKLLEDNDQIGELTYSILGQAARQCRLWRDAGLDLNVSVNLSVTQLEVSAVAEAVTWQVRKHGLEPQHMVLEITESGAMTNVGPVLENLNRLRMKGFGLSIDDYGTGYASMQQLSRIPFTELKIDHSFVSNASHHESNRLILESSLEMAHRLNITSVAEGAETQDDWEMLRDFGCDIGQGYFVAKPMEAESFVDWVHKWQ